MIVDQFILSRLTSTATPSSHLNTACRSTWWTTWRLAGTWRSFLLHMAAPTWVQQSSRAVFTLTTGARIMIQIAGLSSYCVSFFSLHFGRLILHAAFPSCLEPHQSALQCLQVSTSISEALHHFAPHVGMCVIHSNVYLAFSSSHLPNLSLFLLHHTHCQNAFNEL